MKTLEYEHPTCETCVYCNIDYKTSSNRPRGHCRFSAPTVHNVGMGPDHEISVDAYWCGNWMFLGNVKGSQNRLANGIGVMNFPEQIARFLKNQRRVELEGELEDKQKPFYDIGEN